MLIFRCVCSARAGRLAARHLPEERHHTHGNRCSPTRARARLSVVSAPELVVLDVNETLSDLEPLRALLLGAGAPGICSMSGSLARFVTASPWPRVAPRARSPRSVQRS